MDKFNLSVEELKERIAQIIMETGEYDGQPGNPYHYSQNPSESANPKESATPKGSANP
jgi:hypothetical protein